MAGPMRRRPFPYDMVINGQGVMLGRKDDKGQLPLVASKVQPFDSAAPDDYTYDTMPPLFERVQAYNDLSLGMGLRQQGTYQDKKYRYAQGVDCSVAGLQIKGPSITQYTPPTTDATNGLSGKFFTLTLGGVVTLFCAMGRYILKKGAATDVWAVSKDFGAGVYALDVAVFASSGTGTVLAWAALNGTNPAMYSSDGTTWTNAPIDSTTGSAQVSLCYLQAGSEFWRASTINGLSKVDTNTDPTVALNWLPSNAYVVGDKNASIRSLALDQVGTLVILKSDGVYTIDTDGTDHKLFSSVAEGIASDTDNGRWTGTFSNDLYFGYGKSTFRAEPTVSFGNPHLVLEEVGPEKLTENDSPVRGRITAFAGSAGLGAYAALYNDDTGAAFIMKYSSWLTPAISQGQLDVAKRIDAWHGALDAPDINGLPIFAGRKILTLYRTNIGAPAGHHRLYGGCSDGTLFWFVLPCVPNPLGCSSYLFTTSDAYLYAPLWHGTFQADAKTLRGVSVISSTIDTNNSITFNYKVDPTSVSYTQLGTVFTLGSRQRVDFPNNTATYLADFRVTFKSSNTASSPAITAWTVHYAVRPALVLTYDFSVIMADSQIKRNGAPFHAIGATQFRTVVKTAAQAIGSVTCLMPDESSQELSFVDYKEGLTFDTRLRRWSGSLDITAVQYLTNTAYGTWSRASVYSWGDLKAYTWLQAQGL